MRRYIMTEKILKYILTGRGWSQLLCTHCGKTIQVGDPVVSHGQRPRKSRKIVNIYHEDCYQNLALDCALIRRYCPVCEKETEQDTEKWDTYTVCTKCGVLIPWEALK